MFDRWIENGLTDVLKENGIGSIVFSPLAQGLLTNKYLNDIPKNSRAHNKTIIHLGEDHITKEKITKVRALNDLAKLRGQSLAQMAIAWTLNNDEVTSCLIGASSKEQIIDSVNAIKKLDFTLVELAAIEDIIIE